MMQKDAEVGRIAMAVPVIICILHIHIHTGKDTSSLRDTWRRWGLGSKWFSIINRTCLWRGSEVFWSFRFYEWRVSPPDLWWPARALEIFLKCLLTKTCMITESKLSTTVSVAHMWVYLSFGHVTLPRVFLLIFVSHCVLLVWPAACGSLRLVVVFFLSSHYIFIQVMFAFVCF